MWKVRGRGVRRSPGEMNKLEAKYAERLKEMVYIGEIAWFAFDALKLRLAQKTFYEPDFLVIAASGDVEIHEVKGFWEDDARVKIKVAAEKYPFRFKAFTFDKKHRVWIEESFTKEVA